MKVARVHSKHSCCSISATNQETPRPEAVKALWLCGFFATAPPFPMKPGGSLNLQSGADAASSKWAVGETNTRRHHLHLVRLVAPQLGLGSVAFQAEGGLPTLPRGLESSSSSSLSLSSSNQREDLPRERWGQGHLTCVHRLGAENTVRCCDSRFGRIILCSDGRACPVSHESGSI